MHITEVTSLFYNQRSWALLYKLSPDFMNYLWNIVEDGKNLNQNHKQHLAGNIHRSLLLTDKDDRIINDIINPMLNGNHAGTILNLLEKDAKVDDYNYMLTGFWVNFQKKYEFNPIHSHGGNLSFVIWMKIPYSWETERHQSLVSESNTQNAVGNFMFVYALEDGSVASSQITMSPDMEGQIAIFPAYLQHIVYPFYTSDEERISISGNLQFSKKNV